MDRPAVRAVSLRKVFRQPKGILEVLRDVNLSVREGEKVAIVGPSGVGKTTLLHILGGLERPSGGRVYHFDFDLFSLKDEELSRYRNANLGFVFQMHHLMPEFNTLENVMLPGLLAGKKESEVRRRAEDLLELLGLKDRATSRISELSGGEKQRVAVARALLLNPKILFADEPTGNLDSRSAKEVTRLFLEVNERFRTTLVVVTHNPKLASVMDRVVRLEDGVLHEVERGEGLSVDS